MAGSDDDQKGLRLSPVSSADLLCLAGIISSLVAVEFCSRGVLTLARQRADAEAKQVQGAAPISSTFLFFPLLILVPARP